MGIRWEMPSDASFLFLVGNLPSPYALTTRLLVSGLQAERSLCPWGRTQEGAHAHGEGKELVPCKEAGGCCGERCPDPRPTGLWRTPQPLEEGEMRSSLRPQKGAGFGERLSPDTLPLTDSWSRRRKLWFH